MSYILRTSVSDRLAGWGQPAWWERLAQDAMAEKFGGMGLVPAGGKLGTPGPAARDQVESPV
jgi:hypothetical protein